MSFKGTHECILCKQPIHRLFNSDKFPWVHTQTGHPRCKPYDRAYPREDIEDVSHNNWMPVSTWPGGGKFEQ